MTLEEKIAAIDLKNHPTWYRAKLEAAIKHLGLKWPLHPAHTRRLQRAPTLRLHRTKAV